ncbi:MAG TPA: hypothetical protein VFN57_15570 [Thermomicrobiaceae bacterium]|nr:hypothetical protein [Thermomicrobiaceae bacterium]
MTTNWPAQVSEADAHSLTEKLAAFSASLTPGERHALTQAMSQRVSQQGDVQGYTTWDPTQATTWWAWWEQAWTTSS